MVSDGNTYLKFNPLNSVKIDFGAYIKFLFFILSAKK